MGLEGSRLTCSATLSKDDQIEFIMLYNEIINMNYKHTQVGYLIILFAKIADKEPAEWLAEKALYAGLDQLEYSKLLEVVKWQ